MVEGTAEFGFGLGLRIELASLGCNLIHLFEVVFPGDHLVHGCRLINT
jgi:hypothetical protein